jgi:hypothetical protein
MKGKHLFFALTLTAILLFCGCSLIKNGRQGAQTSAETTPGLQPIDIRAPAFFSMLRPWKKGTLLTMDGNARFAEISFVGRSRIRIRPLVNFPRERIDNTLVAAPESDICVTQSGAQFHVADISSGKTKSFAPFINWRFNEGIPSILDYENGIIKLLYVAEEDNNLPYYMIIYDPKNDNVLYKSPEGGEYITLEYNFTPELNLSYELKNTDTRGEYFFYNWKTREITRNELTNKYNALGCSAYLANGRNINLAERFLFADTEVSGERRKIKLTWDENFENVTVIPMDYLVPEGKRFNDMPLSADGKWASTFVSGYRGLNRELLVKRAFFHLDSRYPNGISMPVFVDDYDRNRGALWSSFVEHPVHGWCFAEEKYLNERLYLRLYKMSDVLAEINRQIEEE